MNEQVEQWKPPVDEMPLATVPGAVTHAQSWTDAVTTLLPRLFNLLCKSPRSGSILPAMEP